MRINDHIIDYVHQQLSPKDAAIFENLMKQDRKLAQSVRILKDLKLSQDLKEIQSKLDEVWQKYEVDIPQEKSAKKVVSFQPSFKSIKPFQVAAIAFFLLCISTGGYWLWQNVESNQVVLTPQKNSNQAQSNQNPENISTPNKSSEQKNSESSQPNQPNNTLAQPHPEKLLALLERTHQDQHIPILDSQLGTFRSESLLIPKLDAIFSEKQEIVFQLPDEGENLKIEIFTKSTFENPSVYEIEANNLSFKLSRTSGLYYWRLLRANNEMIHLGRFYVTK